MSNRSPLQHIRARCLDCACTSTNVKHCQLAECPLYLLRFGKNLPKETSRVKAIRRYCVKWCMNHQPKEVRLCASTDCVLYPFRLGKNPYRRCVGSTETAPEKAVECKKVVADRGFFERKNSANGSMHYQHLISKNVYQVLIKHGSTN